MDEVDQAWELRRQLGRDLKARLLIDTLNDLVRRARHIAVVSGPPELSQQDAAEAVRSWQAGLRPGGECPSVDIYGHDWTLHS